MSENRALSNSGLQFPPQYKADGADNVTFIASLIKNCSAVPRLLTLHPGSTPSQSVGKLIKISQEMVSHLRLRRKVEGGGEKKNQSKSSHSTPSAGWLEGRKELQDGH